MFLTIILTILSLASCRKDSLDAGRTARSNGICRSGYIFAGWNSNSNDTTGTDYAAGSSYTLNGNVTLYAKWKAAANDSNAMKITVGNTRFTAMLAASVTTGEFKAMLPLILDMSDFNSNEKVCSLPDRLPTAASNPCTIQPGDIMLYGSGSLVLFYETFQTSYSYTRIGWVDNPSAHKGVSGPERVTVKFELE